MRGAVGVPASAQPTPVPWAPTSRAGSSPDTIVPTKAQNLRLKLDLPVALCSSSPPSFVFDLSF